MLLLNDQWKYMRSSHNCFVNWGNPQSASTLLVCSMEMNPLSAIWLASEKLFCPYKTLCCICAAVSAAHMQVAHMQVAHMCCIWGHACSTWAGRHKLVLCAPRFLHMCSTHLLVSGYVSLECSALEFGQKMRAACAQHFCKGTLPAVIGKGTEDFRLLVKMRNAKCRVHLP